MADQRSAAPGPGDADEDMADIPAPGEAAGEAHTVPVLHVDLDACAALGPGDADEDMADAAPGEAAGETHTVPVLPVDIDACVDTLYYRDVASDACGVVYVR